MQGRGRKRDMFTVQHLFLSIFGPCTFPRPLFCWDVKNIESPYAYTRQAFCYWEDGEKERVCCFVFFHIQHLDLVWGL